MKTARLLLLIWAALTSQMVMAQEDSQQEAYNRLYSLLQFSEYYADGIYAQSGSFDLVRNMVILNDESADQAYCVWSDAGLPDINRGTFKSNQGQVADLWTVLFYGIRQCNHFLGIATDASPTTLQQRAEARFMRAYFYSIALDLWGGVPIYTTADKSATLPRNTGSEVFDYIVSELLDCQSALPSPSATTYGKPSQQAALLLLARLYLNAEVYTGTARWAEAKQQAKTVIDSGSYALCSDYARLFMADNDTNGAQREIVWPLVVDGSNQSNWGNTMYLIAATHQYDMPFCGLLQPWAGLVVRRSLLQKFFPNDNCPSDSKDAIVRAAADDRCLFYGEGRPYGSAPFSSFKDGFSCVKYTNLCTDGSSNAGGWDHTDTDFPLLRYAEAFLILAEADARLNGGACSTDGIDALNVLRQRAHTSTLRSASLETIADEWAREFYFEGRRRSDLVRFGLYSGNQYVWDGKGTSVHDLLPIPDYELARNAYCTQNPGYEDITKIPEGLAMYKPDFADDRIDLRMVQGLWFRWQRPSNFDASESITYGLQLSADLGFTGVTTTIYAENAEELLYDNTTLYDDLGRIGIADGETATVYARVTCHGVVTDPISFSVSRTKVSVPILTWYILGSSIGDGSWNNSVRGLGASCVPLGVVDETTFRFSGHFTTEQFKMVHVLGNWEQQIGSYSGSVDDYIFNYSGAENMRFDTSGNYTLTVHYDGISGNLTYERLSDNLPVYSAVSMTGEFTGWGRDIDMTRVEQVDHSWYATLTLSAKTEMKFRADHDWATNWGAATFPYGQGLQDGNNIVVEPGDYMVIFNDITGDYLFLDANTGTLTVDNGIELVDGMYLNTDFATIGAKGSLTFQSGGTEAMVQVVDPTVQRVESLQLIVGEKRIAIDAEGKADKQQLTRLIEQTADRQVVVDMANSKRTSTVQAVVRGYRDKSDVRVYTESAPFTVTMVEEYHVQMDDAYYYIGQLNGWDPTDRSMPFAKKGEGVFSITFIQPAGEDHWFKALPSTTTDWYGDFVCPIVGNAGVGTGAFTVEESSETWHIPANATDKTYTFTLDFTTMTYTISENLGDVNRDGVVDVADISAIISVMASTGEDTVAVRAADVNGDGVVDVADISAVISIMAS